MELSDRCGTSRIGCLLFSEWPAVYRHADGMGNDHGAHDIGHVPRGGHLAQRFHIDGVCFARGIEMRRLFLMLAIAALAWAQGAPDLAQQGDDVYHKTCATGYCHAPKGGPGGGAPRLAARGFDEA